MGRRIFILFIVMGAAVKNIQAQEDTFSLLLSANLSVPSGDYGKLSGTYPHFTQRSGLDIGEKVGLAHTGFGLSAEMITPLGLKHFEWILGVRCLVNGTDVSKVTSQIQHQLGDTTNIVFQFGNWIHVPIMTGFRYKLPLTSMTEVYCLVQGGMNLTKTASRKTMMSGLAVEETTFRFGRDFGYEAGFGMILFKNWNIDLRYLQLGTPRYEGTQKLSEKQFPLIFSRKSAILGEQRSVSMFLVTLGVYLF